jgi:hypothetical protein
MFEKSPIKKLDLEVNQWIKGLNRHLPAQKYRYVSSPCENRKAVSEAARQTHWRASACEDVILLSAAISLAANERIAGPLATFPSR